MADKIENKDLFAKDAFSKTQKDVEDLIGVLDELNKTLVDLSKAQKKILNSEDGKTFESLKNINKAVDTLNTAEQESTKILKEKLKLENRLAQAKNEDAKINTELKVLIQEQNKLNKEAAKDALGLTNAYQKQSKKLNDLRKEYKNLIISEGKTTKESKKLLKEIKNLDKELKDADESAGQFQRNVGNYPDTLKDASSALLKTAAAALTVKGAFDSVKTSLESTEEGSEDIRKATAGTTGVFNTLKSSLASLTVGLGEAVANGIDLFTNGNKGLIETFSGLVNGLDKAGKSFDNFIGKSKDAASAEIDAESATIDFEKRLRTLNESLAIVNGTIENQISIAGDSTKSFDEIENAALKAQKAQNERAKLQIEIAQEELKISRLLIAAQEAAGTSSIELLNRESEAIVALREARNAAAVEQLETDKLISENNRDRFERELDFAIDAFDSVKTINERRIADETKSLSERKNILSELESLTESSFQNQIKLVQDFTGQKIDLDSLSRESDEEVIRQRLKNFEFDDVTLGRILEIIRERKIATQDLADTNRDLTDSEKEGAALQADILDQQKALNAAKVGDEKATNDALEQLEEDRIQNQIEALRKQIEISKKGSIERFRAEQELNDLLLDQIKDKNEKETKLEEERIANQKELTAAAIEVLSDLVNEGFEKRIAAIDDQLSKTGENIDRLRDKAQEGQLDSQESLAFEQKQELELQRQKEREQKRQERTQAFFAVLSSFNSNDGNLAKTITDISVLKALAGGLTAFDGVDDTGGRGDLDSKGGKAWILHPNEQVWSKKDRGEVGFRSREEMKDIVKMYDNGMLTDIIKYDKSNDLINTNAFALNGMGNSQIVSKLDELNKSIKSIQPITGSVEIDEAKKVIQYTYKKGNRITKEISKLY